MPLSPSAPRASRRATAPTRDPASERSLGARLAALPWVPVVLTLLVLFSGLFAVEPLRDAASLGPIPEARLDLPSGYVAFAPLSDVLDTLTLLTIRQHVAVLVTVLVLYALLRGWRVRSGASRVGTRREVARALLLLIVIVAVYTAAALAPRPMAQLEVNAPNVLAVDFHAHTSYSHDGRSGWGPEQVRDWHRAAGFDAAYVTDHRSLEGASRGIAADPRQAGENTVLLPGIEVVWEGQHVNLLSAGTRYGGLTTLSLRDIDPEALQLASALPYAEPVVVQTIPDDLSKVRAANGPGTMGVRALEVVDGAPRGLAQSRRERRRIVELSNARHLALVAGSDNHGWGRTAAAWTLLAIPGWRGMRPDSLATSIEDVIRRGREEGTVVVERVVAGDDGPFLTLFAGPIVFWRMLTTLGTDERVIWLLWTWAIVLAWRFLRTRRHTDVA